QPVAHDLRTAAIVGVARLAELPTEDDGHPGLLEHLATGSFLVGLVAVALALGEAPVVVPRPVHEQDLPTVAARSHDDAAARADDRSAGVRAHSQSRRRFAFACFHTFGHSRRDASAAARSIAPSSPAP